MHYVAFLIDKHGFIPYKDIFDTDMVGTLLFHLAIGRLLGYGDLAFRIVDISYLLILLVVTWFIMKPFGKVVALTSILLFGIFYLGCGEGMSLQRDYIGIFPIAMAILLATKQFGPNKAGYKAFAIGALFALSASIKPHLVIGLPFTIIYAFDNEIHYDFKGKGSIDFWYLFRFSSLAVLGFMLFLSLPFLWLWNKGGISYFWEMFSRYLPLHLHLDVEHQTISGVKRWIYLVKSYRQLGNMKIFLMPISLGLYLVFSELAKNNAKIKLAYLLTALLFLYSIYPVFAGQFWDYHWVPFIYFCSLLASFILLPTSSVSYPSSRRIIPLIVFALFLFFYPFNFTSNFVAQALGKPLKPLHERRVDEIADFLKKHLGPNDKVQPLDWAGGAIHGMLIAKAVVATPYIHDYHFYHHVSDPYIQDIRKRFIKHLKGNPPKYIIIYDMTLKNRVQGKDTTTEFPELTIFIDKNYKNVYDGNGFKILERQSAPVGSTLRGKDPDSSLRSFHLYDCN
jgi:hypothetical protein